MAQPDSQYRLSSIQKDALVAALTSNQPSDSKKTSAQPKTLMTPEKYNSVSSTQNGYQSSTDDYLNPSAQPMPAFVQLDDSPYLGFDLDGEDYDQFDIDNNGQLMDDLPHDASLADSSDIHDKRKSVDGKDDDDEGGGKRRESEGGTAKKPGRKPLIAEPTSKRKAQNRAAQRAFRDRKEKHLKDLETKVEDLEKASESSNQENGLLRAQVERLQIELREYRKRLSWVGNGGQSGSPSLDSSAPGAAARSSSKSKQTDFQFEFPRFGDPPANYVLSNSNPPTRSSTLQSQLSSFSVPGVIGRNVMPYSSPQMSSPSSGSASKSPVNASGTSLPLESPRNNTSNGSFDSFSGLFSPSILEASRQASTGYFAQPSTMSSIQTGRKNFNNNSPSINNRQNSSSSISNTDSPTSSHESQQNCSSIGTSPEPSLSSPSQKVIDHGLNTISEETQSQNNFSTGSGITPGLDPNSFNWFAQQNGGGFDPVLFGDYRESQDAVASQDFGAFFNDAFPLPELGSPEHNFNEIAPSPAKLDLMSQVEAIQDGEDEAVSVDNTAKMMTCNKIWDRLQSMEKFRNGEIDIANLCEDLKAKAHCTESGPVMDAKDVESILASVR